MGRNGVFLFIKNNTIYQRLIGYRVIKLTGQSYKIRFYKIFARSSFCDLLLNLLEERYG